MEDTLRVLFDYQRFAQNKRLQAVLDDAYTRCFPDTHRISEDMLELSAAGEPFAAKGLEKDHA